MIPHRTSHAGEDFSFLLLLLFRLLLPACPGWTALFLLLLHLWASCQMSSPCSFQPAASCWSCSMACNVTAYCAALWPAAVSGPQNVKPQPYRFCQFVKLEHLISLTHVMKTTETGYLFSIWALSIRPDTLRITLSSNFFPSCLLLYVAFCSAIFRNLRWFFPPIRFCPFSIWQIHFFLAAD